MKPTASDLGFVHRFSAPADPGNPVLLLLHGTGGNEDDLVPLGRSLLAGAGLLSPRGQALEHGMPRFFRRLAEGVFDLDDLRRRTRDLGWFVRAAAAHYQVETSPIVAVGFSNGANIASSVLLLEPGLLAGAVLFRGMVPLVPDPLPVLAGTPVLLSNGRLDPLVSPGETERLATLLRGAGADVTLAWQGAGHSLTQADLDAAQQWLARFRNQASARS